MSTSKFNELTRVQMPALVHLERIGYTYIGKISENVAGSFYDSDTKEYIALVYLSSLYRINSFKSSSAGSIVKFITKGDIESIPVFIPNDISIIEYLNQLLNKQDKLQTENEKLSELRDWLLPMLMNGQATIDD